MPEFTIEFGKEIFKSKAVCQYCHKWDASGDQGYGGNALSLRATQLTPEQMTEVVKCGRPATGMPYHDRFAYTDKRCYGYAREQMGNDIPVTYVPARNTIFLSFALAWAEVLGARDIVIGVNALDYSGYPDCRPEFIRAFETLAALATRAGVEGGRFRVHTPLITMTKAEIIRRGVGLGVDYKLTHSCYDPDATGTPCGRCDSCVLRARGFREAGIADPLLMG
jgi:7-cyano-7-deazaguanine synthase in queuosine biosynthesis